MRFVFASALLFTSVTAAAAPPIRNGGNIGVGLGFTTQVAGLDTKYWMNENSSFQAVLGVYDLPSGFDPLVLGADADFLFEFPAFYKVEEFDFGMNAGAGGIFSSSLEGDLIAGANLVVGLQFHIDVAPVDIALEYRPAIFFLDDINGLGGEDFRLDFVEFGAHVRYWF